MASAYGYNQKGIFEYAEDWPNNRENLKGFLIAINTLEDKNWEGNVKITYTADLNSKIAPERIEWVRKNCLLPLLDEKKVYINTEEGTEDAYYSGKAKYYMSIEATIKQLAFVVNPPPLEIVAIEYFGSKYKNADQLFVNNFHETIPLKAIEKFGRPFPSDKLTWEATEASGVNNTDKLISNKNGDEITFNSKSAPYHSNVVAKFGGKGVALNLFALGFKTEAVKDYVRHTVEEPIPFKVKHNLKSTSGYSIKETTSGPTNYTRTYALSDSIIYWWPYDNNKNAFKPGVYSIKHELIGVSDLSLESLKNITILPSYNLNLVAIDSKNPKRFVGAGDTLYIVENNAYNDRNINITASSSGGNNTFWPLDPNWSINSNHTNKDLDGQANYVIKNIDNTKSDFYKIGVSAFRDEEFVYVKRFSGAKNKLTTGVKINHFGQGVKVFTESADYIKKLLKSIPSASVGFEFKYNMEESFEWYYTEDNESPQYIENRFNKQLMGASLEGEIFLPAYSFQFPVVNPKLSVGVFVGGILKLEGYQEDHWNKKTEESTFSQDDDKFNITLKGEFRAGAKAKLDVGAIKASAKAYGQVGIYIMYEEKRILDEKYKYKATSVSHEIKGGTLPVVIVAEGELTVDSGLFDWTVGKFTYTYLILDKIEGKIASW